MEKEMATHLLENIVLIKYCYLENCMDRGAWQATVHGVSRKCSGLVYWEDTEESGGE